MELMKRIKEGMRRYDELSPEEKDEVNKRMMLEFDRRSRESIEQFNKEIEERLKVSRKTLEMEFVT